jgi:hypothetical protein
VDVGGQAGLTGKARASGQGWNWTDDEWMH